MSSNEVFFFCKRWIYKSTDMYNVHWRLMRNKQKKSQPYFTSSFDHDRLCVISITTESSNNSNSRITMYRRIHQVSIQRLAMRWTPTGKRNRGRPTETWTRLAQESRKQQDMHWTNYRKQDHRTIVAYLHVLYDRSTTVTLCKIRIINS